MALLFFLNRLGFLGSIDANTGSPDLGWDTDQFPMDVKNATLVMKVSILLLLCKTYILLLLKVIIEQGGLAPGGLNFDCKVRRESIDLRDMFISHIGMLDSYTSMQLTIDHFGS